MISVQCQDPITRQPVTIADIAVTGIDANGRFAWKSAEKMYGGSGCDPALYLLLCDGAVITPEQAIGPTDAELADMIAEVVING